MGHLSKTTFSDELSPYAQLKMCGEEIQGWFAFAKASGGLSQKAVTEFLWKSPSWDRLISRRSSRKSSGYNSALVW